MSNVATIGDGRRAALRARLAMVGELAAGVAHELSNPLTGIMGYATLLAADPDAPDRRENLGKILHEAERASRILRNLLSLARERPPTRAMTDLNQLLRDTLGLQAYCLRTHGIEVVARLDPALPMTAVDPQQIQQVLLNLLLNTQHAIPASRQPGRLTFITAHDGHTIEIRMAHNATGMPEAVQARLSEPFLTAKTDADGTGLGMPGSRDIVHDHGGEIRVESQPGAGATFIVTLPIVTVETTAQPATPGLAPGASSLRWLVVDDEEPVIDVLRWALEAEGQEVATARSGAEALEHLDAQPFDYVVTDIRMPGMSGGTLQALIGQRYPVLRDRVVLCTGDLLSADSQALIASSPLPVIEKPFELDLLRALIHSLIATGPADLLSEATA